MSSENLCGSSPDKWVRVNEPTLCQLGKGRRNLASFGEGLQAVDPELRARIGCTGQQSGVVETVLPVQYPEGVHSLARRRPRP